MTEQSESTGQTEPTEPTEQIEQTGPTAQIEPAEQIEPIGQVEPVAVNAPSSPPSRSRLPLYGLVILGVIVLAAIFLLLRNRNMPAEVAPADAPAVMNNAAAAVGAVEEANAAPAEQGGAGVEVDAAKADGAASSAVTNTDSLTATEATTATEAATTTVGAATAAPSEEFNGIPVGFTKDGFAYRGDPNAPVTMIEYSDYQCPFCGRYFVQTEPAINESYVRSGKMRVIFHDFPIEQLHPNAPAAHIASLCVGDQGSAALFWNMHNKLFSTASEWGPSPDPAPIFERLAKEAGADMEKYAQCIADGANAEVVAKRVQFASEQGFTGTPTFQFIRKADSGVFQLVGAQPYDQFASLIDAVVAGESPQTEQAAQDGGEIPKWAKAENLVEDPAHPGYDLAGDQFKGTPGAPLVVVEYTDFQCPYCKRHTDETEPTLDKEYVDTGKVFWIFKHFPLDIHPQAQAAAVAAECASEQGKFWEMKDLLFKDQATWSVDDPTPVFLDMSETLGLDRAAFMNCLQDPAMMDRVQSDMADGAPYVRGTPTFIVLRGEQGGIIPGALPVDRFVEYFDQLLAEPEAGAAAEPESGAAAQSEVTATVESQVETTVEPEIGATVEPTATVAPTATVEPEVTATAQPAATATPAAQ